MKPGSGFDVLAPMYDRLAGLVFGRSMKQSQIHFLNQIPQQTKVLILGGGTGWLLEEISKRNSTVEIWYVELSAKMLERSKKRKADCKIHFIQGTEDDIPPALKFDVVITNFYFDLFSNARLSEVIQKIDQSTKPSSQWVVTEFENQKWWHSCLLKVMYVFFQVTCGIEGRRLPDWQLPLSRLHWREARSAHHYRDFIRTAVWVK